MENDSWVYSLQFDAGLLLVQVPDKLCKAELEDAMNLLHLVSRRIERRIEWMASSEAMTQAKWAIPIDPGG